jgi:UDP-GalNAc:undecaprenyl-phosphate GalNAc-1-phosphate transferase
MVKRSIDLFIAFIGLVLCLPFILVSMLIIRATSSGPAIFLQERVGREGKTFIIYKLRTLREESGTVHSRVTAFGAFLRKTHLDEVTQFWNVLMGDMSIVGPRPHSIDEFQRLRFLIPGYERRALVVPGMVGIAQTLPHPFFDGDRHRVRADSFYLENRSLGLDMRALQRTARIAILGRRQWTTSRI